MALDLSSPAFTDGDPIPDRFGYTEANVNPPLTIKGVPADCDTLALIVDDPDAVEPAGKVWDHWVVWNIDASTDHIPEDWSVQPPATEGQNDYGEQEYGGPNPPDRQHTYRFELLALDTSLDLPPETDADRLRTAAQSAVIDSATLTGTYSP